VRESFIYRGKTGRHRGRGMLPSGGANRVVPYLSVLHTPDEDLRFFRERVFPTLYVSIYVSIGDVTPLAGYWGFRDGWVEHLYVDPAAQGWGLGSGLLNPTMSGVQRT
jgi:GNAT superfamily N-acetyltransferase